MMMAYTEAEARREIIEAGHRLLEEKLVARTWGNISARISDTQFIITPSGRGYDTLQESELVVVNIEDCSYDGTIKPSSEKGIHAAAYRLRKDCNFVVHTHQFYASAVCAKREDAPFAPCASYGLPGTKKLKKNVEKCFLQHPQEKKFLLANHGAVILGNSSEDAFQMAMDLENESRDMFMDQVTLGEGTEKKEIKQDSFTFSDINCSPFVATYLKCRKDLPGYIDDFVQIVGERVRFCPEQHLKFGGNNAVLIENVGALCATDTEEDLEAISCIVEKNCAAALYAHSVKPLGRLDSKLQRYIYLNKYSKLKQK